MAANILAALETYREIRGGKYVWVKDSNGESRDNVTLGCTIANPPKGFGHLWAGELFQYTPFQKGYIFRSFSVKTATATATDRVIYLNGDGYSDIPEVGMTLMVAPESLKTTSFITNPDVGIKQKVKITFTAGCATNGNITVGLDGTEHAIAVTTAASTAAAVAAIVGAASFDGYTVSYTATNDYVEFESDSYGDKPAASFEAASTGVTATLSELVKGAFAVIKQEADYVGQSGKVTAVTFDSTNEKFIVTLDTALGSLTTSSILVESVGSGTDSAAASATATVLVTNPNTFIEADIDLAPTDGRYNITNVNYAISTVSNKKAWIERMQPLPAYVLAKNRSNSNGIFWI
jgi:hypothetical protein